MKVRRCVKVSPPDNIEAIVADLALRLRAAQVALDLVDRQSGPGAHLISACDELDSASVSIARLSRLVHGQ